jgi:hypothetical protein
VHTRGYVALAAAVSGPGLSRAERNGGMRALGRAVGAALHGGRAWEAKHTRSHARARQRPANQTLLRHGFPPDGPCVFHGVMNKVGLAVGMKHEGQNVLLHIARAETPGCFCPLYLFTGCLQALTSVTAAACSLSRLSLSLSLSSHPPRTPRRCWIQCAGDVTDVRPC